MDFPACLREYLEALRTRNYARDTITERRQSVEALARWCLQRGIARPLEVTRGVLEGYQRTLMRARKASGDPYSVKTQYNRLVGIVKFFRWLARANRIVLNPAADLEMPRLGKRLPREILTAREVERVLAVPDVATPLGLRDRAILEFVYSTGLRRRELANLRLVDVDLEGGTAMVREGKGRKDRVVPIGARALEWLVKYLDEARPELVKEPDEGHVFASGRSGRLSTSHLTRHLHEIVRASGVGKGGAVHVFRHAMATGMLEGGADIRYVQAMLGHEDLSSTQIYTRVAIGKLREVHRATHPAERKRKRRARPAPAAPAQPGAAPPGRAEEEPRLPAAPSATTEPREGVAARPPPKRHAQRAGRPPSPLGR